MILVVSALNTEVDYIKKHCILKESFGKKPFTFFKCSFNNVDFLVAKSGLGKVRSASFVQYAIDNINDVELVVNFGSAGAVSEEAKIGDTYFCIKAVEYDFFTTRNFKPEFEIELKDDIKNILKKLDIKIGVVVSATQNVDSIEKKKMLFNKYGATVGDWEASAIVQVCKLNKVNSYIFKAVTDLGNENILNDYKINYKSVLENSGLKVLKFIEMLKKKSW